MTWLEWIVLILASSWALTTNLVVRNHYKKNSTPALGANMDAMLLTFSVVGVLILHKSPLHLFWLFPLSYIAGFIFNPYKSKVFAFLPWLYGYILSYTIPANW
jgi:hypothetical protein